MRDKTFRLMQARAEAAEAALAASRAPDPVANAGSCQAGDMISRAAAVEAVTMADKACLDAMGAREAIRALTAVQVDEAPPTIGGAGLDALVARLLDGPSRVYRDIETDKRAARFIAAARDLVPALAAERAILKAESERLRAALVILNGPDWEDMFAADEEWL